MNFTKRGLIYAPDNRMPWASHSALTPTPVLMEKERIRIFAGFRDELGVSRIGYVDLNARNPAEVIAVGEKPSLDIGAPGCFDDNGVILGEVIKHDNKLIMYYVGFQIVKQVKFLAFTGQATSEDGGVTFTRSQVTPVLDRAAEGRYIRAIHTVLVENGIWKVWYAAGDNWAVIKGVPFPSYEIRYLESTDGIHFKEEGQKCIVPVGEEYRIGRPRVYHTKLGYEMYYTKGTLGGDYLPGHAVSADGVKWVRDDKIAGLELSKSGWDSRHLCYPSLLKYQERTYAFYNGNDMGKNGFGYAELTS